VCHPSLCDDNLSGISIATLLAAALIAGGRSRHTFRFVYAPGTIGAITWLSEHPATVPRIKAGLTLTCLGDGHPFTYKRTERTGTAIDRAAEYALATAGSPHQAIDFFPYGYDERQYNSPGFRAPVGSLMRGRHGQFAEYHTSADNLSFVDADHLVESYRMLDRILGIVDLDRRYVNLEPYGEPQLGNRGLYHALGGTEIADAQLAMLWVLNQSDGSTSLLDIAARSGIDFAAVAATAAVLAEHGLLVEA
jgi:aminopeptidase-like protein